MSCLEVLAQVGRAALRLAQDAAAQAAPEVNRRQLIKMNLDQR